jgi:hypothetical protein
MSIKPDDCVIYLDKLSTWEKRLDPFGRMSEQRIYPPYWEKFLRHANKKIDWSLGINAQQNTLKAELKKHNATYKQTKNGSEYVKFKSHSALTMFILRWS